LLLDVPPNDDQEPGFRHPSCRRAADARSMLGTVSVTTKPAPAGPAWGRPARRGHGDGPRLVRGHSDDAGREAFRGNTNWPLPVGGVIVKAHRCEWSRSW
jgi:hypothetical protein